MKDYKLILTNIYENYNPAKLGDIDELLLKNKGQEELLLERIAKKYNIDIEKFLDSEKQSESIEAEISNDAEYEELFGKKKVNYGKWVVIVFLLIVVCLIGFSVINNKQSNKDNISVVNNDSAKSSFDESKDKDNTVVKYLNPIFGYAVVYPVKVFKGIDPGLTNTAKEFKSYSGDCKIMTNYCAESTESENTDIKGLFEFYLNRYNKTLEFKHLGDDYFLLLGRVGKKVYFEKYILKEGTLCRCEISFPFEKMDYYKPIAENIFTHFVFEEVKVEVENPN